MSQARASKHSLPSRPRRTHRVVMFGYPDAQMLDITGPLEVFGRSTRWLSDKGVSRTPAYTIELVAPVAGAFAVSSGIRMVAERSFHDVRHADTLLISGGIGCTAIMRDERVLRWIRRMAATVSRLGSVCNGALILARAGLLDDKSATTHWGYTDQLAAISDTIKVQRDAIYVRDGNLYTSGGVTAGLDMALAMVESDWGQATALAVAQQLVMFLKRPGGQSQFSRHLAAQFSEDDKLRKLQLWVLDHLDQDLYVANLAAYAAMSERNFARRFTASVGMTPAQYVSGARLDAARRKLEENSLPISRIARLCGFGTDETMRRSFAAELGVSPSDYRERFRSVTA